MEQNIILELDSCTRALLLAGGSDQREAVEAALQRIVTSIEQKEAPAFRPFVHEVRAQLARVCGDEKTCKRERAEAERLWTDMGAHGHIERMDRDLEELGATGHAERVARELE